MIEKKVKELKERRAPSELKMAFFDSINIVPPCWDNLINESSIYLSKGYLSAIENAMNNQLTFRYILFSKDEDCIAIAAFQIIKIDSKSLDLEKSKKRLKAVNKVVDQVGLNCLINGSLFSSGELGFYYSKTLEPKVAYKAFTDGVNRLCDLERSRQKIQLIMVKEFFPESKSASDELIPFNYRNFKMEPNMVLELNKEWNSIEDYFASMTSKYRNKAKNALKRSSSLEIRDLSVEELIEFQPKLQELFHTVHSKAKYKLGTLEVKSFIELKRNLKSNFSVKGYFFEETLVGFGSLFINHNTLDSNYVGLDYELNKTHGIYQRILFDLVELGIEKKVEKIQFGRTASEIKSNFGAKAVDMECYVRTKNSVSNKLIKPLIKRIERPDVIERNPFKE